MTLVRRRSLWRAPVTWVVVGAGWAALFVASCFVGVTSLGLPGMQADEICAGAGLGYDAEEVRATEAQPEGDWPFTYPCSSTTDAVPFWVNPVVVLGLWGAPASWAVAGALRLRNRRTSS